MAQGRRLTVGDRPAEAAEAAAMMADAVKAAEAVKGARARSGCEGTDSRLVRCRWCRR